MLGKTPRGVSERPKSTKTDRNIPSWIWLIVLICAGIFLMVFLLLWRPWQPSAPQTQHPIEATTQETNQDYRFYDLLPQQQVTPIPEQAIPQQQVKTDDITIIQAPPAAEPKKDENAIDDPFEGTVATSEINNVETYILQVRSFEDPDQADARRVEIIQNGLAADVIITNENNKVWYRVISGPYYSQESAKIAQQTLQNSGVDSFIVKQSK